MYKLLLVDDEPLIRRGIRSLADLENIGISEIVEAENGEDALEKVQSHNPQIILMDINMPDMDGLTAAQIIKENNPEIFIIILTGYDYFEYAQAAIRAKVDDYILKPITKTDIEEVLVKTIGVLKERNKQINLQKIYENSALDIKDEEKYDTDTSSLIIEYLKENIFSPELSLAKMAEDIGFNSSYLSTTIKQIYGIPFQEYVNKKRMEKAKILLLSSTKKNYEIAEQVGIEDVNYFITKFKKACGITPKQYRNEQENNEN